MGFGWCGLDGRSQSRQGLWESASERSRRGWAVTETEGLKERGRTRWEGRGKPRFLSNEQERELTEEVSSGRFKTAGDVRDWIESEYAVSYKHGSVYGLLKRLGCSPKVPRGRHEKADVVEQQQWKGGSVAPLPGRA